MAKPKHERHEVLGSEGPALPRLGQDGLWHQTAQATSKGRNHRGHEAGTGCVLIHLLKTRNFTNIILSTWPPSQVTPRTHEALPQLLGCSLGAPGECSLTAQLQPPRGFHRSACQAASPSGSSKVSLCPCTKQRVPEAQPTGPHCLPCKHLPTRGCPCSFLARHPGSSPSLPITDTAQE